MGTMREKLEIIVDILKVLKGSEVTKTSIVYKANLNFKRANHYLDMMMQMGLIEKSTNKYNITETGNEYFKVMNEVNSIIIDQKP
ncbi:MAG: winged helix-turn-helix domain-containing protein [Methanococcoides sp.]|nr:winged helix-turn-helix domain-containing protein [Methanococcoides sp.]